MQSLLENISCHCNGDININDLAEICDVKIDQSLPQDQRVKSYIHQIKDPTLYRCGDTVVRISFADTDATLEDRMKQYLLSGACRAVS